ncbi:fumarylacetoacetate hydrolase family protein [Advenella sp. S44]|uniref:fumarylacetoacetate hydrolase family protein n=1 Tax=Advenella sp. S44 TaxID=1982755 RepID=UPI0013747E80|nr:fumarylacetoacetate hydrolase family protein [Advenella sp. S44]
MSQQNFNLGRYQVNEKIVIGRPDNDFIEIVHEHDDLPYVLSLFESDIAAVGRVTASDTKLLVPLDPHARIFSIAVNYRAHGAEAKAAPPQRPLMFYKAPSNFVGHGELLNPNSQLTSKFDYEGEIAVVIGRECKNATLQNALDFVAGVCAFNDGSARDLGKVPLGDANPPTAFWPDWTANKALDAASAIGPTITCGTKVLSELRDRNLRITTRLNDETVQSELMSEMIFSTEQIIATLSSYMKLLPGDVIATGTPAGVGVARNRFLKSGDRLEFEVSGLDALKVTVS